jgi:PAS domain S-box-containing protein
MTSPMSAISEIEIRGLAEAVRHIPAAVAIVDASGALVYENERARALVRGRPGAPLPSALAARTLRSGQPVIDAESSHLRADGGRGFTRWSCSPMREADGRIAAAVVVIADVTAEKKAEGYMSYFDRLLENTGDAIVGTDADFRVTEWNPGAERLYGYAADEVRGRYARELDSFTGGEPRTRLEGDLSEGGRARSELTAMRKDGTSVEVEMIAVALHDERGEVTGYVGIHRRIEATLEAITDPGTAVRFELSVTGDQPQLPVRTLLVEDHAAVREAIAATFEREPGFTVVGQAGSLAEARDMLGGVDVAVLDLFLPDGVGSELIKDLHAASPGADALVLSAGLDPANIARAVQNGAAGVLDKAAHLDEVLETVRRLRAGDTLLSRDELVELLSSDRLRRDQEHFDRQAIETLTQRELDVLRLLAEGRDSQAIAGRLHISGRTERNHVANILGKLGVHSRLQALVFVLRYGVVEIPRSAS